MRSKKAKFQTTDIKDFIKKQYSPTWKFVEGHLDTLNLDSAAVIAVDGVPARNVGSYQQKIRKFATGKPPSCATGSILSKPLVQILCADPTSFHIPSRKTLPTARSASIENGAAQIGSKIMFNPLMQDPLIDLANDAEYYAPLYDYSDLVHNRLFKSKDEFFRQPNLQAHGPRLLNGALQTLTVRVAQLNMLYGDLTADMVFTELWDESEKTFKLVDDSSTNEQKLARDLLKINPYLASNVLMLALDRTSNVSSDGQAVAYKFALNWKQGSAVYEDGQLQATFSSKLAYRNVWVAAAAANDSTAPAGSLQKCSGDAAPGEIKTGCSKATMVNIAGTDVLMPAPEDFAARTLAYPTILRRMVGKRDEVAQRLADYEVFDWATKSLPADQRNSAKQKLVQAIVRSQSP
jgi:hypothetical protein